MYGAGKCEGAQGFAAIEIDGPFVKLNKIGPNNIGDYSKIQGTLAVMS